MSLGPLTSGIFSSETIHTDCSEPPGWSLMTHLMQEHYVNANRASVSLFYSLFSLKHWIWHIHSGAEVSEKKKNSSALSIEGWDTFLYVISARLASSTITDWLWIIFTEKVPTYGGHALSLFAFWIHATSKEQINTRSTASLGNYLKSETVSWQPTGKARLL
jgi:hypothetical protein